VIPGTVPYSSAALVNPTGATSGSAIDPATGIPYATELAAQTAAAAAPASSVMGVDPVTGATTIFGVDWYYLAGAAVLLFVVMQKRGR
jgi:hypothetical protein